MKFRQYSTQRVMEGAHRCNLCGKPMPKMLACKCSVKIRLEGDQDVIEYTLEQPSKVAKVFIPEPAEYGGGVDSTAVYITVYVANPDAQWDPEVIARNGYVIEQS